MARRPRAAKFETRSARLKLAPRPKPYPVTSLARGLVLRYRRNSKPPNVWDVKVADGRGGAWTRRLAVADDYEDADGERVLDYGQAISAALALVHGGSANSDKPATWATALDDYEADLRARNGDPINASRVRRHLTPALLNRPVATLTAAELKRWRNDLVAGGMQPGTVKRVLNGARASLNMAADHNPTRINNRNAWRVGLSGLTDTYTPVNRVLSDADVLRLVEEAYALDANFGLFVDVLASTGTRTAQACGLLIRDLQTDRPDPRLLMPSSRKGGGKRKIVHRPVPIPTSLGQKLKRAASNRDSSAPLLVRSDGSAWDPKKQDLRNLFAEVAKHTKIGGTAYQLRHSSIVRALLAGTPIRLVAVLHDTGTAMIEKTYAAFIADHGDVQARRGLLDTGAPSSAARTVVPISRE